MHIYLVSQSLYEKLYLTFFGESGDAIPGYFLYNEHIRFHLCDRFPGDATRINQIQTAEQDETAFLDDRYDFLKDVSDPWIKTIWYNPGGEIVGEGMPIQDLDISHFEELKEVKTLLHKPSLTDCLAWWDEWNLPDNIRRHSSIVARSAYVLAVKMRHLGIAVDPILAHRAGLLHDIDKIDTLKKSGAHGKVGADFLAGQGFPEIAKIVREHIMSTILHPDAVRRSWENKLVFFCDKLVEGDNLVSFDERLAALKIRYPDYVKTMERAESAIWALSDEICEILGISSHVGLIEMLKDDLNRCKEF